MILAIDPGPSESAWLLWDPSKNQIINKGISPNIEFCGQIIHGGLVYVEVLAIEMIACYGMAVGKETFETCVWIGRFMEMWAQILTSKEDSIRRIPRLDVKINLCKSAKGNDANVRQALIDRLGPVGTRKLPGPLFGVTSHCWAALAVAVTCADQMQIERTKL